MLNTMLMSKVESPLRNALQRLVTPLVRLLLRHGVAYGEFSEVVKKAYVEVANQDFAVPGRKQSLSRVAVLTGIHRHEVKKLLQQPLEDDSHRSRHNRAARVIGAWLREPEFSDEGEPKVLSFAAFTQLVNQHGGDVTPRTVLDELMRIKAVERPTEDEIVLIEHSYVPTDCPDDLIHIFGDSVGDLIATFDHNLQAPADRARLQMSAVYSNIPDESLANVALVSQHKSMEFLHELNRFFATQDRDGNPALKGSGRNRAGIGIYYFEQPYDDDDNA